MQTENIIRILTISSLAGLLGAVGLRLKFAEVIESLRQSRFSLILLVNLVLVPLLTLAAVKIFGAPPETGIGMLLLAAAPFAPVVPVFSRLTGSDLALAAGLTSIFPFICVFVTPVICDIGLKAMADTRSVQFHFWSVFLTLAGTITLPLALGIVVCQRFPAAAKRLLKPMEVISEATGALSLGFVSFSQWGAIVETGWRPLLAMGLVFEMSLVLGYGLGAASPLARQTVGFGTSNRNIALALLVALQSFPGTTVMSAVVANGLLMIGLGLVHVACWRLGNRRLTRPALE